METREASGDDAPAATAAKQPALPSPLSRPTFTRSPASNPNFSTLPPLVTSNTPRAAPGQRKPSYASKRLSAFSNNSAGHSLSRPQSNVFPFFLSSLPYALVRDFAYPAYSQLHYGPPLDQQSSVSTPASEISRRVSDPHGTLRSSGARALHSSDYDSGDASYFGLQLPARSFGDGPPYAEDDDLLSPVVTTTRHKKTKSNLADYEAASNRARSDSAARALAGLGQVNSKSGSQGRAGTGIAEPHATAPLASDEQSAWRRRPREESQPQDPNSAPDLHYSPSDPPSDDLDDTDESRLSRAYQFTIASPDEEFHGKAVALFDFERENDNELPFFEGQVLWVSYRHGEGWLVAQDPKSGESGLIPEEYVRLLRDIEGGLSGLKGEDVGDDEADLDTPVELRRSTQNERYMSGASGVATNANGEHYAPVLSQFTTSSKDLEPYSFPPARTSQQQLQLQLSTPQHHVLGSQQTTPVAPSQSQFDAPSPEAPTPSTSARDSDDGGVVLLSPETFKREELHKQSRTWSEQGAEPHAQLQDQAEVQDILKGNIHMDTTPMPTSPTTAQSSRT